MDNILVKHYIVGYPHDFREKILDDVWKSVRASFIYRKNGEKWKKELEKEEKQENGKSRKADKNKEISYMWKNGKKSRK